jgi:hypothetical protein
MLVRNLRQLSRRGTRREISGYSYFLPIRLKLNSYIERAHPLRRLRYAGNTPGMLGGNNIPRELLKLERQLVGSSLY